MLSKNHIKEITLVLTKTFHRSLILKWTNNLKKRNKSKSKMHLKMKHGLKKMMQKLDGDKTTEETMKNGLIAEMKDPLKLK